jgi:hypothetical protein
MNDIYILRKIFLLFKNFFWAVLGDVDTVFIIDSIYLSVIFKDPFS